jgi:hypothetical protein
MVDRGLARSADGPQPHAGCQCVRSAGVRMGAWLRGPCKPPPQPGGHTPRHPPVRTAATCARGAAVPHPFGAPPPWAARSMQKAEPRPEAALGKPSRPAMRVESPGRAAELRAPRALPPRASWLQPARPIAAHGRAPSNGGRVQAARRPRAAFAVRPGCRASAGGIRAGARARVDEGFLPSPEPARIENADWFPRATLRPPPRSAPYAKPPPPPSPRSRPRPRAGRGVRCWAKWESSARPWRAGAWASRPQRSRGPRAPAAWRSGPCRRRSRSRRASRCPPRTTPTTSSRWVGLADRSGLLQYPPPGRGNQAAPAPAGHLPLGSRSSRAPD